MFEFPFSNLHELNLDWILKQVKKFSELIVPMQEATSNVELALENAETALNDAQSAVEDSNLARETAEQALIVAEQAASGTIADGAVTSAKLAAGAVTTGKIAGNAVTTSNLQNACVTSEKIPANAIITGLIANGAVTNAKISDGAISGIKIQDSSVSSSKLAANAVTIGTINPSCRLLYDIYKITLSGVNSSNRTFNAPGITSDHKVFPDGYAVFSNPTAVRGYLTIVSGTNSITVNGSLSGSTDISLVMCKIMEV